MTKDEIIRMAREAGMETYDRKGEVRIGSALLTGCDCTEQVERFAELVKNKAIAEFLERSGQYLTNDATREAALAEARAEEREACVMVCYDLPMPDDFRGSGDATWEFGTLQCADAIRARGES